MAEETEKYYHLIISFLLGKTSPEEDKILGNWKNESPENSKFFDETRNTWLASSILKTQSNFKESNALESIHKRIGIESQVFTEIPGKKSRSLYRLSGIAALLMIVFSLGGVLTFILFKNTIPQQAVKIIAPKGSRSIAFLPDGSQVWLNAGSEITYSTSQNNRLVRLKGEAYFKVKSDHSHPFIVQAKNLAIRAVGTSFNVKAYPEENKVVTTLVEGVVNIEKLGDKEKNHVITLKPNQKVTIYQDQKLFLEEKDKLVSGKLPEKIKAVEESKFIPAIKAQDINTELYTSWKENRWIIEGEEFGNLAVLLERRYNVNIMIISNELKNYRFSGTFTNETIEQALSLMRYSIPFNYIIDRNNIILKADPLLMRTYNQAYGKK